MCPTTLIAHMLRQSSYLNGHRVFAYLQVGIRRILAVPPLSRDSRCHRADDKHLVLPQFTSHSVLRSRHLWHCVPLSFCPLDRAPKQWRGTRQMPGALAFKTLGRSGNGQFHAFETGHFCSMSFAAGVNNSTPASALSHGSKSFSACQSALDRDPRSASKRGSDSYVERPDWQGVFASFASSRTVRSTTRRTPRRPCTGSERRMSYPPAERR